MQVDDATGICIQIGLLTNAEMFYLTQNDWQKQILQQPDINKVPDFNYDKWVLYGIDSNPASIAIMLDKYGGSNVSWICAYVSHNSNTIVPVRDQTSEDIHSNLFSPTITLSSLINGLALDRIDVLKIDIEGSELQVISNYQFEIKPRYISIECHEMYNEGCTDRIQRILEMQGYDISNIQYTNIGRTIELQAILPYSRR